MIEELKRAWYEKVLKHGLADERIIIHARPLKPEEVIGWLSSAARQRGHDTSRPERRLGASVHG